MRTVQAPVIRDEQDHAAAVERMTALWGAPPGSQAGDELDVLFALVEAYERIHHAPIEPPTPIEAVRFLMDQKGLSPRELASTFGDAEKVEAFLEGKLELSKPQIVALHRVYGIPYASLLG